MSDIRKIWNKSKAFAKHGKRHTTKFARDRLFSQGRKPTVWYDTVQDALQHKGGTR